MKKSTPKAAIGFEAALWEAADLLRNNVDPSEYKHVVLGLLFLKYISDAFEERREQLTLLVADEASDYYVEGAEAQDIELNELLEDRDEYTQNNVFWVPVGCTTPAVDQAACLCSRSNLFRPTMGSGIRSLFMDRSPTTPPGDLLA